MVSEVTDFFQGRDASAFVTEGEPGTVPDAIELYISVKPSSVLPPLERNEHGTVRNFES
jgi:hypothetical protein